LFKDVPQSGRGLIKGRTTVRLSSLRSEVEGWKVPGYCGLDLQNTLQEHTHCHILWSFRLTGVPTEWV